MLHVLSFCREGLAYTPSKNNCADVSDEKKENFKSFPRRLLVFRIISEKSSS